MQEDGVLFYPGAASRKEIRIIYRQDTFSLPVFSRSIG